ncbi:gamma-glutamylcyclotransferase [Deinococcus arcticus]|uniref:gamma-glutamylcyclotransferase n=1 Tax=Deinococcus arcticus TaxID=2136176 RepID=UPI0011B28FA3|nr:gamma-glutamylcyclotransferase [Deinococcus arcticus]
MSVQLDGQQIRARRELLGLTLQEVASKAGVTRQYVSSVEAGKIQLVPPGVARIVETVGLTVTFGSPETGDFPRHFFTYGSMKPGFLRAGIVEGNLPEGHQPAFVAGYRLYDSGMDYPCLVRSDDPRDLVHGVVYEFTDLTIRKALQTFDVIEGVNDNPPLFRRHRSVALSATDDPDQSAVPCWVYLYVPSVKDLKPVKDGTWTKEKGRRK